MFGERSNSTGVIGLGIIGTRVAGVLRDAKRHVYVWNRSPKAEPNFVASPEEMAGLTEVIQIFLTDGPALLDIVGQMLPALTPDHIILNHSTVALDDTYKAEEMISKTGATFLDAPFTGSREAAAAGELCYYVSGTPVGIERAEKILEPTAKAVVGMGPVGQATVLKIATNMISATTLQALSEAMALVSAQGVDPALLETALKVNACRSGLIEMKVPSILKGDFEPHFSLKNMFKDAQFGLDLASAQGLALPAISCTAAAMLDATHRGHGERDYSILAASIKGVPGFM